MYPIYYVLLLKILILRKKEQGIKHLSLRRRMNGIKEY